MSNKLCVSEFGTIPKDLIFNNLYVTNSTTICNNSNLKTNGNVVVLNEKPTSNAVYDIRPSRAKTIYFFSTPLKHNTEITFNVDNSQSQVGDQMIWLLKNAQDQEINITGLNRPNFYFYMCGSISDNFTIPPNDQTYGNSRLAQYWAFDGTSWIYSTDNY